MEGLMPAEFVFFLRWFSPSFFHDCHLLPGFRFNVVFFFGILCAFETESCSTVQTGLKPVILLPQLPKSWGYRHVLLCLPLQYCFLLLVLFFETVLLCRAG